MPIKSSVSRKENAKAEIKIEIPVDILQQQYEVDLKKFSSTFKMPGFREGKVPREMIVKNYHDFLCSKAVEHSLTDAYYHALEENKLMPYSDPKFSEFGVDITKPLVVTATLELYPTVELAEYSKIPAARDKITVSDEDMEHELEHLREEHSDLVAKSDGIALGDIATVDLTGSMDGKELPDATMKNYRVELKKDSVPEDLSKGLMGLKKDEEKDISVRYPNDYFSKRLAGQKVQFKVKVLDVQVKKLPALDDEFAKDIDAKFATLADLKADIRKHLDEHAARLEESRFERALIAEVASKSRFDIPGSFLDEKVEENITQLKDQLKWRNMTIEAFFEQARTTEEKHRASIRMKVMEQTREDLTWLEICQKEGIKVDQAEMDAKIKEMAAHSKVTEEQMRDYLKNSEQTRTISTDILYKKAMDFLRARAAEKKGKTLKYAEAAGHNHED